MQKASTVTQIIDSRKTQNYEIAIGTKNLNSPTRKNDYFCFPISLKVFICPEIW